MNSFDTLPTDVKLHLFSFLRVKDVMAVTATNRTNKSLQNNPHFWRHRAALDFGAQIPNDVDKRQFYLDLHNQQIVKIRELREYTVGLDRQGNLHIPNELLPFVSRYNRSIQSINKFAAENKILDIWHSSGGSTYLLTKDGLFGYGNNYYSQMGINSNHDAFDKIISVFPARDDEKIIGFAVGMNFIAVLTTKKVWIAGDIVQAHDEFTFEIPNEDIVKVRADYYKLCLQRRDNSFIVIGRDHHDLLLGRQPDNRLFNRPHFIFDEFANKNIIDYFMDGSRMLVWCDDGIYIAGENIQGMLGPNPQHIGSFFRLDFFDDKIIQSIHLSPCHIVVHCQEGIFVEGMNNTGRLGTGDDEDHRQFTKLAIDPAQVTNIQCTAMQTFIELNGKWHMAGKFRRPKATTKPKLIFESVEFSPLNEMAEPKHHLRHPGS